jgi:hypothetical protein
VYSAKKWAISTLTETVSYELEWCNRENMTAWCKRMKREKAGFGGLYIGVPACYRPKDRTVCLGKEFITNVWMRYPEEEAIAFLIGVICHEEDHRAIHEVTGSVQAALRFDYLFSPPFNFKENMEYMHLNKDIDLFKDGLTEYGKWLVDFREE